MESLQDKKNKEFMKRLNYAIEIANINATQLAKKMGRSRGLISNYRNGNKNMPNKEIVKEFAKALNVSPQWLNLETDEMVDIAKVKQFEKGKEIITEMVKMPVYTINAVDTFKVQHEIKKVDYIYMPESFFIDYLRINKEELKDLFFMAWLDNENGAFVLPISTVSDFLLMSCNSFINNYDRKQHIIYFNGVIFNITPDYFIENNNIYTLKRSEAYTKYFNKQIANCINSFNKKRLKLDDFKNNVLNIPTKSNYLLNKNDVAYIGSVVVDFKDTSKLWNY